MTDPDHLERWGDQLGLVAVPLFGPATSAPGTHGVLLDGGLGSFALSVVPDLAGTTDRSFIWSSDLPHHVVLSGRHAFVDRWDGQKPVSIPIREIETRLEDFYRFLLLDRVQSRQSVVEHSIMMFRRLRSLLDIASLPPKSAVELFLLELSAMNGGKEVTSGALAHPESLLPTISSDGANAALRLRDGLVSVAHEFQSTVGQLGSLKLMPDLAIRHAGGAIFQEAHYELARSGEADLFAGAAPANLLSVSRGGVHFTPPALARILAEEALRLLPSTTPASLTIFDAACGSGAFLYESIRTLGRSGFKGSLHLIGRDTSEFAVTMARFVLDRAKLDWPHLRIIVNIEHGNSLRDDAPWQAADVVLMNPPFIRWREMTAEQKDDVQQILGASIRGQPDYSTAFIEKAVTAGRPGIVIGSLLPASLLSNEGAAGWRDSLTERAVIPLICAFGDYGLFRHALVQVGALVMQVSSVQLRRTQQRQLREVWTAETPDATGNAIRALRQLGARWQTTEDSSWSINAREVTGTKGSSDWRPRPGKVRAVLDLLATAPYVQNIFTVSEGVRAGSRETFTVTKSELLALPIAERRFFRPVAEGRNIREGEIREGLFLFFPKGAHVPQIENERDLIRELPNYFRDRLSPNRDALSSRAALVRRTPSGETVRWWELNWDRPWQAQYVQKIVSAYYGQRGSFAFDETGEYVVLQGHAWRPKSLAAAGTTNKRAQSAAEWSPDLYRAYVAILNSKPMDALLEEFCPRVAGGQFDLSKRFVEHIPFIDLSELLGSDPSSGKLIEHMANLQPLQFANAERAAEIDNLVAQLFRVPLPFWPTRQ
jgi:adenine-specific DNA-methyltransferase